jgi:hypothetical protein
MFNPWFALSLKAVQMGVEAQSGIALRMLRLATGGARTKAEAAHMVTEKVASAARTAEAQAVAAPSALSGRSPHVVASKRPGVVKKRVRANKRRVSSGRRAAAQLASSPRGKGAAVKKAKKA